MPRTANRGSQQPMQANTEASSSSQQAAQGNATVGYDDQPVFGAAFSGISGATNTADLMPRNTKGGVRHLAQGTEANRGSQEAAQTNPAASYDEQPVLGAAASGISGAADAAGLDRRTGNNTRVNHTPGKNAGTSNSQADENQPVRDAAYTGVSGVPIARLVSETRIAATRLALLRTRPSVRRTRQAAIKRSPIKMRSISITAASISNRRWGRLIAARVRRGITIHRLRRRLTQL